MSFSETTSSYPISQLSPPRYVDASRQERLLLNFDTKTSIATAVEFVDVYSGDEIRKIAYDNPNLYSVDSYSALWGENTNWQEELFQTSISTDNNISFTGAYKALPYRVLWVIPIKPVL